MTQLAKLLIRFYQLCISPLLGSNCRFRPTCSEYAYRSFEKYGFIRGCWLTAQRVLKCGPWHPGGRDDP